jgi:hypothetical protein
MTDLNLEGVVPKATSTTALLHFNFHPKFPSNPLSIDLKG